MCRNKLLNNSMLVYSHFFILKEKCFKWNERALLIAVIFVIISERKWFNKLWIKINNKSIHSDVWQDIIDYNGTTLRIVCDKGDLNLYQSTSL